MRSNYQSFPYGFWVLSYLRRSLLPQILMSSVFFLIFFQFYLYYQQNYLEFIFLNPAFFQNGDLVKFQTTLMTVYISIYDFVFTVCSTQRNPVKCCYVSYRDRECQAFRVGNWCKQMLRQECTSVRWKLTWTSLSPSQMVPSVPSCHLSFPFCQDWGPLGHNLYSP